MHSILTKLSFFTIWLSAIVILYGIHIFVLDGVVYNKPIVTMNYQPNAIPLQKDTYSPGEEVLTKPLHFCKNRQIIDIDARWSYRNGVLSPLERELDRGVVELPVGCYDNVIASMGFVPESAISGTQGVIEGVIQYQLTEFSKIKVDYSTEIFNIK